TLAVATGLAVAACHRSPQANNSPTNALALAMFASQQVVVTPTSFVRPGDALGWVQRSGGTRPTARQLDSAIATALDARGMRSRWILPPELWRAYQRNRSYATDPYQLATEIVRTPAFVAGKRYGEPLS